MDPRLGQLKACGSVLPCLECSCGVPSSIFEVMNGGLSGTSVCCQGRRARFICGDLQPHREGAVRFGVPFILRTQLSDGRSVATRGDLRRR